MPRTSKVVDAAVAAIMSAQLTPTEHLLLKDLVANAVDADQVARYILGLIEQNSDQSTDNVLRSLKRDWRRLATKLTGVPEVPPKLQTLLPLRDGPHCSLTEGSDHSVSNQMEPAYIIPPTVFEDPDMASEGSLHSLLETFLTPPKVSQMRNLLRDDSDEGGLKNLWLLSPSIHSAFRNGHVQIRPKMKVDWDDEDEREIAEATEARYTMTTLYPEECTGLQFSNGVLFENTIHMFTVRTKDPVHLCLPSAFLFRVHYRFSNALHLFSIEDRIAKGWPWRAPALLGRNAQLVFRRLWLFVPKPARVWCYRGLSKAGPYFYPSEISYLVKRVPLGLYIKHCEGSQKNEPTALKLVEQYTSVPAPLLIDTFQDDGNTFMVMTRVRGQMLKDVFHLMSYAERDQLSDDLAASIKQLRRIPNHTPYTFADTTGGEMVDHRVPDGRFGPFNSEADFNSHLYHMGVGPELRKRLAPVHSRKHRVFFTHSDLHTTNLLIYGGRLSGIVDWECAAFKPEYWEFTKAMYGVWNRGPEEAIFHRAFGNAYMEELEAEQALWRVTPFGI
ncbi:hypothetical protein BU16DRAFT_518730 [Lophium mytilinum]|uniref:Aminoglycoside phosphotransferase domain-containing protein n=1 Tax=Lophium mytilinum TaxID=390894 RepID=A0A6A6QDB4_9PEZI|nr:hypothetical protein BU16DRAFT_518730 [Lophium mytilinum]